MATLTSVTAVLICHYPSYQLLLEPKKFCLKETAPCLCFPQVFGDERKDTEGNTPERDDSKLGKRGGPLARF